MSSRNGLTGPRACIDSFSAKHSISRSSRFNLRRLDVCFRGEKDEIASRKFLKLLDVAGYVPTQIRLTVRAGGPERHQTAALVSITRARDIPIKRLPPPGTSPSQARAYARWVGFSFVGRTGNLKARVAHRPVPRVHRLLDEGINCHLADVSSSPPPHEG